MSTRVVELYDTLRAADVADDKAKAAANAVMGADDLATITDIAELRTDLAWLEARVIRWNVGTIIAAMAVFAAIVKLL